MNGNAINIGGIYADLDVKTGNLQQGLAAGRDAMKAIEAELKNLDREFNSGAIRAAEYNARLAVLNNTQAELVRRMADAHAHVAATAGGLDLYNKAAEHGVASTAALGRGLMQLGYMADDLQYGFGAIVNNIAPMVQGFGGSNGLAAAVQVAAVAANQLYKRWDEVREAFGDTSAMEEAQKGLDGMVSRLKTLQEDAKNFSWGDQIALALGLNPDAGKAQAAANLAGVVKNRQEAERQAKSMEGFRTDGQKESAERFKQAVGESGGIDHLARMIGDKDFSDRGAAPYLSGERTMGGVGKSQRDEYAELQRREGTHEISDTERERKHDLEDLARNAAREAARERIGAAVFEPLLQQQIGDRVGGHAGDVLAGREGTEKDKAKALEESRKLDEKYAKEAEKDEAERRRRIKEEAEKARPDLGRQTDRSMRVADYGEATLGEVKKAVAEYLVGGGMKPKDAADVAADKVEESRKVDPRKRAERVDRENLRRAELDNPGVDREAELAAAREVMTGKGKAEFLKKFKAKLAEQGLTEEEQETTARSVFGDADLKVRDHLAGMSGDKGKGEESKKASHSEVYGSSDLSGRVQAAISDRPDEGKKQTTLQEQMVEYLSKLVDRNANVVQVKVKK